MPDLPSGEELDSRPDPTSVLAFALFCVSVVLFFLGVIVHQWRASQGIVRPRAMSVLITSSIFTASLGVILTLVLVRRWGRRVERQRYALCTHCLGPHRQGVHFCPTCAKPLTFFAGTGFYERVYAQMWALGKGAHHPSRWLHVVGMVLICGLAVAGFVVTLGMVVFDPPSLAGEHLAVVTGQVALLLVTGLIYTMLLFLCLRNWRRFRRAPEMLPAESTYGTRPWWTYDRHWEMTLEEGDDAEPSDDGPGPASAGE